MTAPHDKKTPRRFGILEPAGLALRALEMILIFSVAHLLGWREHVSFLSGTMTGADASRSLGIVLGIAYGVLYLAATVLAPTLLLAAGLLAGWQRFGPGRRRKDPACEFDGPVTRVHRR